VRRWKLRVDGWRQAALSARQRVNPAAEPSMPMCGGFETMLAKRASKLAFGPLSAGMSVSPSLPMDYGDQLGTSLVAPTRGADDIRTPPWGQSCVGRMAFVRTAGVSRGIFE